MATGCAETKYVPKGKAAAWQMLYRMWSHSLISLHFQVLSQNLRKNWQLYTRLGQRTFQIKR